MSPWQRFWMTLGLTLFVNGSWAQTILGLPSAVVATNGVASPNVFIGWATNGAAIFQNYRVPREWNMPSPTNNFIGATNQRAMRPRIANWSFTNHVFAGFLPESLNQLVWTNFIAHTNGRDLNVWSQRTEPVGWPTIAPVVRWNTNSLVWGMTGMTALSPCWEGEGSLGQVPITLLTRRHGYTRGHSMGAEGFNTRRLGSKAWFLAADNSLIVRTIRREVVRVGKQGDYTLFIFDRDLPDSIQPMRVVAAAEAQARYLSSALPGVSCPVFKTEQSGQVSAEVTGLTVNTWKGGDSGSPNMLPLPGELVFFGGRSTSGPSPNMQADMDALSNLEGLSPKAYQLRWVDLSKYPIY